MTNLLCKLFVKDHQNLEDPRVRARYGVFSGIVGILVNLLLFVGKLIVGLIFTSVAIMADAFNNLSDAGSSIVSMVSFRISAKPADRDHPFGHARIEYLASMIVSFLILLIGFELITESIDSIRNPSDSPIDIIAMVILGASILMKVWLFFFYRGVGKKIDSGVLKASAFDSLSDVISTSAVLVTTIIIHFTGFTILDGIVGLIVACLIIVGGIKILKENMNSILGEAPSEEIVDGIREVVREYPEALGIHDLIVHNYGPGHTIASLHIEVDGTQDLFALHDVIDNIERQMREQLQIECTVHMDPIAVNDPIVNELREKVTDLLPTIGEGISLHDFRVVTGPSHTNLIFDMAVPFEIKMTEKEASDKISALVKEKIGQEYYCVVTVDRK
ncbi:MAG: cation diffusion facilitator family transporter [Clostridia bacterium]|nr:cation diffusion facilitator family transporter [Clostridia bacterium]MDY6184572.1 cation diffusion facilitator family transporter [Eubacteriales bacterium]